MRLFQVYKI